MDKDHLIDYAAVKVNGKFYYTGEQVTLSAGTETSNLVVKAGKNKVLLAMRDKPQAGTEGEDGYYVTYTGMSMPEKHPSPYWYRQLYWNKDCHLQD